MSRVGKLPIKIPTGVNVVFDGPLVNVTGPKGTLSLELLPGITASINEGILTVARENDEALLRARHGLTRSLINNLIVGVSEGFSKKLEINGVGYKVNVQGQILKLNVGFSHDVNFNIPEGIKIDIEQNIITVSGINRQQVGQITAEIRAIKKPEPYKGKGIKYVDERIIRKSGKSGKEK